MIKYIKFRHAPLCKLRGNGFSGKVLHIIEAMLINVVQVPKINNYFHKY